MLRTILRIAGRDFRRRPAQTLLIIAGLLVSSLVMSAALVAGDSMESLFLENTYSAWGPIDVAVGSISGVPFPESLAEEVRSDEAVRSLSDGASVRLVLRGTVENPGAKQREPSVQIIGVDPLQESTLGTLAMDQGRSEISGATVVINARLAKRLDAKPGTTLQVLARGGDAQPVAMTLEVGGVAHDRGLADNGRSPNVFADIEEVRKASRLAGMVNVLVLSAPGEVRDERGSRRLEPKAAAALKRVTADRQGLPDLSVRGSKADEVDGSREQSSVFRSILTMLGSIVSLASIALIVNLFVMLGEERRAESGTLRALGLRRGGLVILGLIEGLGYAAAAAMLGSISGAAFGRYLARLMGRLFASFSADSSFDLAQPPFEVRTSTLVTAGLIGLVVTMSSVAFVAIRTSRLTVIAAIRGLPEGRTKSRRRLPWAILFAAVLGGSMVPVGGVAQVIGGGLLCVAGGGLVARYFDRRLGNTLGSLAGMGWGFWANTFLPNFDGDPDRAFAVVTTSGVVTVIGGVVLVSSNLGALRKVAVLFGPRIRAVFQIATGYAWGYRFRTAMSMAMFGLVLFMIAAFAIWGGFGGGTDYRQQSGGADVFARSTVPIDEIQARGVGSAVGMHVALYDLGYRIGGSQEVRFPARLFGVDEAFASETSFKLSKGIDDKPAREVWRMLVARDDAVVIDASTDPGGTEPGEYLTMRTDSGRRRFLVVGVAEEFWMRGIFVSKEAFAQMYPSRAADTAWLIDASPGTSPLRTARSVEATYGPQGMDADTIKSVFEEGAAAQRTFVGIFQLLLKMGLVIGISGLGIGAIRTVLERRQAIGILRAMGFRSWMVGSWLILESLLVATLGVIVGLFVGLLGTYWLVEEQIPNFNFAIDVGQVRSALVLLYVAVGAFTVVPAIRAARLRPSEAVRYVE